MKTTDFLTELSNTKLGKYKAAAGIDAAAADKAGDYKRGDKRMSGIIKATNKEFANDAVAVKANKVKENHSAIGMMLTETRTYKLWESAGRKLMEAELTAQQIQQIFQQVEQGATAAGGNRTMLGKGKDAASAVNKAWEDLKTKVQDSGPIKGVDAMYDKAAEQLKQATGGDQGVMQYVQKYRDFAKKHPVAQSLIYSALIAAAGISGAGIGGAAALGLFKLVDKLLQGEKFSSAAYQGAKTGAMAYGASKIGDLIKGQPQGATPPASGSPELDDFHRAAQDADGAALAASGNATNPDGTASDAMKRYMDADSAMKTSYDKIPVTGGPAAGSSVSGTLSGITGDQMASHPVYQAMIQKFGNTPGARQAAMAAAKAAILKGQANESINLSESQIFLLIGKIVERQRKLDEGIMDTVKSAAGSAMNWAQTKGTNLTTKITLDKLLQAWKKAGSPTDSDAVSKVMTDAGVPTNIISSVFSTMKIPAGAAAAPVAKAAPAPVAKAAPAPVAKAAPAPVAKAAPTPVATKPAVNPELEKRLAARKAGKPQYAGNLEEQGVAEGAPELLKKEMPLHRHAEKLLAQNGVSKDDPDYHHHLGNTIKHLRQFGNIDLINKQGVAEGSGGNWYIRVNGKILNDTKFKPVIFSSEDEARSHAMKLADKKRIPLSQIKLTKSWMDAPEQGVAEGWKDAVVGGAMALGALGAGNAQAADLSHFNTQYLQQVASGEHPRPMVSVDDAKAELQARANGKQQSVTTPAKSEEPKGFSKEYLQKAADPNRFGRYLISVEKAQELLNKMQEGVAEGGPYGSRNPDTMSPNDYDRYQQDQMDQSKRDFKRREMDHELGHERNNYAVAIDGRTWKVFADQRQAQNIARSLKAKGKNATVHVTGANPTMESKISGILKGINA